MSKGGKGIQIQQPLGSVNKAMAQQAHVKLTKFTQIKYALENASEIEKEKLLNDR